MQCSFLTQEIYIYIVLFTKLFVHIKHDSFVLSSQINQNGEFEGVGMEVMKQVLSGRLQFSSNNDHFFLQICP